MAQGADGYHLFNPRAYLQNNYTPPRANFEREDCVVPWKLRCFAASFATGEIRGATLLDIGSGPTLYQVISACDWFDSIIMSDYLEVNREELRRWLRGDPGAFDWTPFIKYVCGLEDKRDQWPAMQQRMKDRIKEVTHCDVTQRPVVEPLLTGPVDAISTTFCLESVSGDKAELRRVLANITALLRPGGTLLMVGALGGSFYMAGEVKLSMLRMDEAFVREAVGDAGYNIRVFKTYTMPPELRSTTDDVGGVFYLQAHKL